VCVCPCVCLSVCVCVTISNINAVTCVCVCVRVCANIRGASMRPLILRIFAYSNISAIGSAQRHFKWSGNIRICEYSKINFLSSTKNIIPHIKILYVKAFLKKKDRGCINFYDFILPKPASVYILELDLLKIQTLVFQNSHKS